MLDKIVQIVGLVFFGIAVWLITKEVERVGLQHIMALVLNTPLWVIGLVVLFTIVDYVALSGYDILSFQYIGRHLPYAKIARTSGVGFAVSNTTGHAYLAGGSIRYLFYIPEGLSRTELALFIAFESLTILIGMGAVFVIAMGFAPFESAVRAYASIKWLYGAAVAAVIMFGVYYMKLVVPARSVKIAGTEIKAPSKRMTIKQILVGLSDNIAVFLAFYAILSYHIEAPVILTFVIFIIAQTLGISTQVPGGVGVFEGLFLYLFPHTVAAKGGILASLVIFRVVYYFIPFIIAAIYLIGRMITDKIRAHAADRNA